MCAQINLPPAMWPFLLMHSCLFFCIIRLVIYMVGKCWKDIWQEGFKGSNGWLWRWKKRYEVGMTAGRNSVHPTIVSYYITSGRVWSSPEHVFVINIHSSQLPLWNLHTFDWILTLPAIWTALVLSISFITTLPSLLSSSKNWNTFLSKSVDKGLLPL